MSKFVPTKDAEFNVRDTMQMLVDSRQRMGIYEGGEYYGSDDRDVNKLLCIELEQDNVDLSTTVSTEEPSELVSLSISFSNGYRFILNASIPQTSPLMLNEKNKPVPINATTVDRICTMLERNLEEEEYISLSVSLRLYSTMVEIGDVTKRLGGDEEDRKELLKAANDINRYFTSGNGSDVNYRIPVGRDEWRGLYALIHRVVG